MVSTLGDFKLKLLVILLSVFLVGCHVYPNGVPTHTHPRIYKQCVNGNKWCAEHDHITGLCLVWHQEKNCRSIIRRR